MTLMGPEVHFTESKYFERIPMDKAIHPVLRMRLKQGASDKDKRELEEFVNHGLKSKILTVVRKKNMKDPYWTWDGQLIEKSKLPKDYPYSKGWKGIWDKYYKMLDEIKDTMSQEGT